MSGWQSSSLPPWQSFVPLTGSTTFQKGTALLSAPYNIDYNGNPHRNPMDMGAIAGAGTRVRRVAAEDPLAFDQ